MANPQQQLFTSDPAAHPVPRLDRYDWILVATSAGKDSSAMLDYMIEVADLQGYPHARIVCVHADPGIVEWPGVRDLAERHARHYRLRFEVVRNRNWEDLLARVEVRGLWPDAANRYCSSEMKTSQCRRVMTRLATEWRQDRPPTATARPCRILNCLGLRAAESPARAKKPAFAPEPASSTKTTRHVDRWLPIHTWTTDQVWDRVHRSGLEIHPAYTEGGMPRLSCSFCVLASKAALVRAAQLRPDLAERYVQLEAKIGHNFRADVSIAEIVAEATRTGPNDEPVTVPNWNA